MIYYDVPCICKLLAYIATDLYMHICWQVEHFRRIARGRKQSPGHIDVSNLRWVISRKYSIEACLLVGPGNNIQSWLREGCWLNPGAVTVSHNILRRVVSLTPNQRVSEVYNVYIPWIGRSWRDIWGYFVEIRGDWPINKVSRIWNELNWI